MMIDIKNGLVPETRVDGKIWCQVCDELYPTK